MATSSISSDLRAASASIVTGKNRINAITFLGDGTNVSTLTVYDNTTGSGKVLAKLANRTSDQQNHVIFTMPVIADIGLYAVLGGTGGQYIIYYGG